VGQIYVQVRIPARTGINSDDAINTFVFTGVDEPEDQATVAAGKLWSFYNELSVGQTIRVRDFISGELNTAGTRAKIYDLSDPKPRVPIWDQSLGVGSQTSSAASFPSEVALCLSYQSEPVSGVAQARRRGRIYIGPLAAATGTATAQTPVRPVAGHMTSLGAAAKALSSGPVGTQWCVWSRKNSAFYPITHGYVDNAFDTQRRRGVDTTSKSLWTGGLG